MSSCTRDRWIDIFITKPDMQHNDSYEFDDHFVCSVQSVRINPELTQDGLIEAAVVDAQTDWIMPTWTNYYNNSTFATDYPNQVKQFKELQVGDLIRIGQTSSVGFTDYLTIVEVIQVDKLYNACHSAVTTNLEGTSRIESGSDSHVDFTSARNGIAHYAFRLNFALNATKLPSHVPVKSAWNTPTDATGALTSDALPTLATRHNVKYKSTSSTYNEENLFYPMYVTKRWLAGRTLTAALDHGVKQVNAIKLMGYTVANKRQVGLQHAHETLADDYIILRIAEFEGHVVSNNRFANGAFAVLHVGSTSDNVVGAIEYSQFEPEGIVTKYVDAPNSVIRNLTIDVSDRRGQSAHFGRLHLWFKLHVTHG